MKKALLFFIILLTFIGCENHIFYFSSRPEEKEYRFHIKDTIIGRPEYEYITIVKRVDSLYYGKGQFKIDEDKFSYSLYITAVDCSPVIDLPLAFDTTNIDTVLVEILYY